MVADIEFLKSIPYFSGLNSAELDAIRKHVLERPIEKGEIVLLEGEPANELYFVISGVVKVFKISSEGKEQILKMVRPGESFTDIPIFDDGPSPFSAQAMTPVVLYGIRRNDVAAILRDYSQVAQNAIKVLAGQIRHYISMVEELSFKHVSGRLAKIVLDYAGDRTTPKPRLTQQDMAAMAGTAREMIGRSLKALEEDGVIKLDRQRIVITDNKALKEKAGISI